MSRKLNILAGVAALSMVASTSVFGGETYDWSGFYGGINGGYGTDTTCWFTNGTVEAPETVDTPEGCQQPRGVFLGGQIGYNWQLKNNMVVGLETQINWADMNDVGPSASFPSDLTDEISGLGLFTVRAGYALGSTFIYVKGGAAYVKSKYDFENRIDPSINGFSKETRWGGALGIGVELGLSANWSAGFEYNHLFLGKKKGVIFSFVPAFNITPLDSIEQNADLMMFRINYRL